MQIDNQPFRLFIIAGEPSGDALALSFVNALRSQLGDRQLIIQGVGHHAVNAQSLFPMSDIAVMGFAAVIQRLPLILRRIRETATAALNFKPDMILSVDSPDFSLRVLKKVRASAPQIRLVHWVCPSVWAWRPKRARKMKPHVDLILALLPFEPDAMQKLGGPQTVFVGHPLIERLKDFQPSTIEQQQRDDIQKPTILILPGSRSTEIRHLLPVFKEVVAKIAAQYPQARFVLPAVPHLRERIENAVQKWPVKPEIITGESAKLSAFRTARAALAASGTVTLELALSTIPTVAAYKVSPWEAMIARRMIQVPTVLLPNLILGERCMPEFLQEDATVDKLSNALSSILQQSEARETQIEGFLALKNIMKSEDVNPAQRAVQAALFLLSA